MVKCGLARTFQSSRPLDDRSVLDNVALALTPDELFSLSGFRGGLRERARTICERVGLGGRTGLSPSELPHAGLLRLELAGALATDPDLLLIDEPLAGLSGGEVEDVSGLLTELREEGLTLVVVDHDMRGLLSLIDRAIVIRFGSKLASGTPEEIRAKKRFRRRTSEEGYELRTDAAGDSGDARRTDEADGADSTGRQAGAETSLAIEELRVSYGKVAALRGIDLRMGSDEIVSVIGSNGAGKTTLAETVSGFHAYEGSVRYYDTEVSTRSTSDLVSEGLIHCTEKRDLFSHMSVADNLGLGAFRRGNSEERRSFVDDLFPVLEERADQHGRTMSGANSRCSPSAGR
jgi:ABC-type branched-subunit amino acid transport system ATPase component